MPATGIDAAIRELQHEQERIQGVISALKSLYPGSGPRKRTRRVKRKRTGRKLSQAGRRRISIAAKKRWAAIKAAKK